MNVVDSCGWLEYFADEPNAAFFAPAIEATEELLVSVPITLYARAYDAVLWTQDAHFAGIAGVNYITKTG